MIGQKLRRRESFLKPWVPTDRPAPVPCGIWIGGGVPIFWEFAMKDGHHINRERIEHLLQSASCAGGLFVSRQLLPAS